MKKGLIALLFLFSISLVFAFPTLELNKQNFQLGETLLGNITGNFASQISSNDISFYQGEKQVFMDYNLASFNNTYYLDAYPTKEGNFTIKINNILYKDSTLKSINLVQDFSVKLNLINESNRTITRILSIKPGIIFSSGSSELTLFNLGTSDLNLTYTFEENSSQISLFSGQTKNILINPTQNFSYLLIDSYEKFSIPIIYTPLGTKTLQPNLKANPSSLQVKLKANETSSQIINLFNLDNLDMIISIAKNSSIVSLGDYGQNLSAKSSKNLTLTFYSENQGFFSDNLSIMVNENNTQSNFTIPIEIYVFPQNTSQDVLVKEDSKETCSSSGGTLCSSGQICNGTSAMASDGYCCFSGSCYLFQESQSPSSSSSLGWIIGIIIILILGIIGFFVYKKYKTAKLPNPEDKIKEVSKAYEKRLSGKLERS
jgi:hypothetical protein